MQTSFNLALGSGIASIGLTIPVIAIASIWLDAPLVLGLESMQIVLFAITMRRDGADRPSRSRDAAGERRPPRAVRGVRVSRVQPLRISLTVWSTSSGSAR